VTADPAVAVRPGEHACCRFVMAEDRWRIASALVRDGLRRGHRVIYFYDRDDVAAFSSELVALDDAVGPALARGQLVIRAAATAYAPDGTFSVDRMLESLLEDYDGSLGAGYSGTTLTGEMGHVFRRAGGAERMAEYERRLDGLRFSGSVRLCLYDHDAFDAEALSGLTHSHDADLAPDLAAIGRSGSLAAARLRGGWLRLAGELDFEQTAGLDEVLAPDPSDELRFELADLRYVDVAGLRSLRGDRGQRVTIADASAAVERLAELLAWDTDPSVALVEGV
jgi:hypothetical protein